MIKLFPIVQRALLILAIFIGSAQCIAIAMPTPSGDDEEFIERKYAPDREVNILHITIDVTPDFESRTINGVTTIKFAPIAKPLTELKLDAFDILVSSVTSSANIDGYNATDEDITITFDPAIQPGEQTTVAISYEAEPKDGLYFRTPELGYKAEDIHLFTQGESHFAPFWYPNYDYPNERSTSEVICRVPKDMTVLSNGRLMSEDIDPNTHLKAVRWYQDTPHVNYLIALVAGELEKIESKHKDIPLAFYTTPSNIEYAQNSFKDTADIMAYFEKEISLDFPWNKYYQVTVKDFVAGGMENTTLTILADRTLFTPESENIRSSQLIVAHEMAHQWFGDYVTCKDWSHLWLNEGFATYYEKLYDGYKNGKDQLLYSLYRTASFILSAIDEQRPIVHRAYSDAEEQFNFRTYGNAAWVLHMLRCQLGENLYRDCVKTFLTRHGLSSVVTEDFVSIVEQLSGRSYDRFFDQWVRQGRFPELNISYNWSQNNKLAKVSIKQTQKPINNVHTYYFPAKIRFIIDGNSVDKQVSIDSKEHDFYFPLLAQPQIVRFDPDYSILAKVNFDKPRKMFYAQLENSDDVIGQLLAIEELKSNNDKKTVEKLKSVLNNAPFYGVRIKASAALQEIATDEAFAALSDSIQQPDARVRQQVMDDIGQIYRPEGLKIILKTLKTEKNPEILATCIRNLGCYHGKDTTKTLTDYLNSKSFRNRLADAAISAIRKLDDPYFISKLKQTISRRQNDFTTRTITRALDTLAYISRNEEDKADVREFLTEYVNHKNRRIQATAISALGTLGDSKAIPVIETFSSDEPRYRLQRTANRALKKLREEKKFVPEEVIELREVVDELKKETDKMKDDLEDLKKQLTAEKEHKDANNTEPVEPNQPSDKNEPQDLLSRIELLLNLKSCFS